MLKRPLISVVVPVYNEERNVEPFLNRLIPTLEKVGVYEILFCLDPSSDSTETVIMNAIEKNSSIGLIIFSRRFGQPSAVMAGIRHCMGEACVVIDVDMQDPPEFIRNLYGKFEEGYDVVTAKRSSRKGETLIKRAISHFGYKLINSVSEVSIPRDTGDFRIMGRRVIEHLCRLKEEHGFLRGLVSFIGFKQTSLEYERDSRLYGRGNYNRYFGSLKIGFNGLIGFSNFLLDIMLFFGLFISVVCFIIAFIIIISRFLFHVYYPVGTPTIIVLILFIAGIQLISVGILGQYIGRIYNEVKNRPQFIVDRVINVMSVATLEQPNSARSDREIYDSGTY